MTLLHRSADSGRADRQVRERREACCQRCPQNKHVVSWRWLIEFCGHPGCGCPMRWWWPLGYRRIKVGFRAFVCPAGAPVELFPRAFSPVDSARWRELRFLVWLRRVPEIGELMEFYRWVFEPPSKAVRPPFKQVS